MRYFTSATLVASLLLQARVSCSDLMLCATHSLPMRPCLTASKSALKASLATSGGNPWFASRSGSAAVTTSTQAVGNSANDWEKDLADVLREPEVKPLLWRFVLLSDNSMPKPAVSSAECEVCGSNSSPRSHHFVGQHPKRQS